MLQSATPTPELSAAILQAAVTTGLALLFITLHRRTQKPFFRWFALAWSLYAVRIGAIITFLRTEQFAWLYWHQILTGWTALALLGAALALRTPKGERKWLFALAAFPPLWSYIAVFQLESFQLAAWPAVAFLSGITLATAWVVWVERGRNAAPGAGLLSLSLLLWGLHHLDYPLLRAKGAWVPWGYYLDIAFGLLVGAGGMMLVLGERARELERLQRRMLQQHEDEKRRLSLHLHDETAQVFTALRLRLGVLRERASADSADELDRALALLDDGLASIRGVTQDLRPALLDDIGLAPALKALADESGDRFGLVVTTDVPAALPKLGADAELTLYRALQEALSNVARHAGAKHVQVSVTHGARVVRLTVKDDGAGFGTGIDVAALERAGHLGLSGMHERLAALGGQLSVRSGTTGGAIVVAEVPCP
jgi:signal transduction histidine kinase